MHTQDQIRDRIQILQSESLDALGFRTGALVEFLDYDHAKVFLRNDTQAKEWNADVSPLNRESVLKVMREYMKFAWEKALDERGISASRSVQKFYEWLWILDDAEILAKFENAEYAMYGKPKLRVVSEAFDFPIPEYDDGDWVGDSIKELFGG